MINILLYSFSSFSLGLILTVSMVVLPFLMSEGGFFYEGLLDDKGVYFGLLLSSFAISRVVAGIVAFVLGPVIDQLYGRSEKYGLYSLFVCAVMIPILFSVVFLIPGLSLSSFNKTLFLSSVFIIFSFFIELYSLTHISLSNRLSQMNLVDYFKLNTFNTFFHSFGMAFGILMVVLQDFFKTIIRLDLFYFLFSFIFTLPLFFSFLLKVRLRKSFNVQKNDTKINLMDVTNKYKTLLKSYVNFKTFFIGEFLYFTGFSIWNSGLLRYVVDVLGLSTKYFIYTTPLVMFLAGILTPFTSIIIRGRVSSLDEDGKIKSYFYAIGACYIYLSTMCLFSPFIVAIVGISAVYKILIVTVLMTVPMAIMSLVPTKLIDIMMNFAAIRTPSTVHSFRSTVWLFASGFGFAIYFVASSIAKEFSFDGAYAISLSSLFFLLGAFKLKDVK